MYNQHITYEGDEDEIVRDELDNPDGLSFIFMVSSLKCPHSKKFMKMAKSKELNSDILKKTLVHDIIDLYKKKRPIPKYVTAVPCLIISDDLTDEVVKILVGDDAYKWYLKKCNKSAYFDGGTKVTTTSGADKGFYGNITFNPKKIPQVRSQDDAIGLDSSMFQEPIEPKGKGLDYSEQQKEYEETNRELGIRGTSEFTPKKELTINDDLLPNQPAGIRASNAGSSKFKSLKKGKGKSSLSSFNS